jgi:hypothetical protein
MPMLAMQFVSPTSCWSFIWFCIATVKLLILLSILFRTLSLARNFLPIFAFFLSWSLTTSLQGDSILLKHCPLQPCWRLSKGKLGLFYPKLKPWLGQKQLEYPMKFTSWQVVWQLIPVWPISQHSSHAMWESTILRWLRPGSPSFFIRRSILLVSISTSSSWWTFCGWGRSAFIIPTLTRGHLFN